MGVFVPSRGLDVNTAELPAILQDISGQLADAETTFVIWNDFLNEGVRSELFPALVSILEGGDVATLLGRVQESKALLTGN
jgi:hypothetical protein